MALAVCIAAAPAAAPRAIQEQKPAFRVAVDLVPVDVQVIDRTGHPVAGLTAEAFDVSIGGRRRRVVSAELVGGATPVTTPETTSSGGSGQSTIETKGPGRLIVLAIDCLSFSVAVTRNATEAARDFVERLSPGDRVGLFAYPVGPRIDPTTDHASVVRALAHVVGQRETTQLSLQFRLRPSEIIDLAGHLAQSPTAERAGGGTSGTFREQSPASDAARRECPDTLPDDQAAECFRRLTMDVTTATLYYEGEATASIGNLRSLLRGLGTVPGRKTLVLLSGGMIGSDRPGVRPDISDLAHQVGREAALANTAVYTLNIDVSALERISAQSANADLSGVNMARDSALLSRWLSEFSGQAGGTMFKVLAGSGETAYERILTETSAYYLLGVEVAETDRDGRTHEIQVKVKPRGLTVRGRKWVAISKRGTAPAPAPSSTVLVPAAAAPFAAPPRPLPATVRPLADAFERGDYTAMERALERATDLANLIRDFREADRPWPDALRRSAVLALEIGLAGLHSDNGYARDEGTRLLAEYNTVVRQIAAADPFECAWLWTEAAGLESAARPAIAAAFISRSLQRCPNEPRLYLANAVVAEQQWLRGPQTSVTELQDVMRRYEEAMKYPETEAEARVRGAGLLYRTGSLTQALELLSAPAAQWRDRYVRYLADLVRGQVLRSLGRPEQAEAAFRSALEIWDGAQSARVALMTLLVSRGDREGAVALATAAETAPDDQNDPWWTYWLGDGRVYPDIIARLREIAR